MSFGSGVLVSVLSFELMAESFREGGLWPAVIGFFAGGLLYTLANEVLAKHGARHRKRSQPPKHEREEDSGTAIALGALLDGIPESIAIGLSLLAGSGVGIAVVVGIFVSNFPEGLSSATGMKSIGKSKTYIFGLWSVITLISGIASWSGYALLGDLGPPDISVITAGAAGAILAMIADTMIPEAFSKTQRAAGMITVIGFLCAFIVSKIF